MNYYWVNVGKSYQEVLNDGFLWAPEPYQKEDGKRISSAGWKSVPRMKKGDIVFCNKDKTLIYAAVVREDSYPAERPASRKFDAWKKEGNRVEVQVLDLAEGISVDSFKSDFIQDFNANCVPMVFNKSGEACEQYSAQLTIEAGEFLLEKLQQSNKEILVAWRDDFLSKDYRHYDFPFHSSGKSWVLKTPYLAVKRVDKTLKDEKSSGIPQDIVSFFIGAPLAPKTATKITVHLDGNTYEIDIKCLPNERHKIVLTSLRKLQLSSLFIDTDTVWFEKVEGLRNEFVVYTKSKNQSLSVPPRQKDRKRPTGSTSRAVTGTARVGQEYFKQSVSEVCKGKCVVTGVSDQVPSILIGSHIKSWVDSDDDEKMDGHNGLLLAPHIDKLFDRHLITFSKTGEIVVSNSLEPSVLTVWGIDTRKQYLLTDRQQEYLDFHREKFEKLQA